MKQIIWTSRMDLSADSVKKFCKEASSRYGKSEMELRQLPLLELASCYMWNERRRLLQEVSAKLSVPTKAPILVIADKEDLWRHPYKECFVLSGSCLADILKCKEGLVTTFFSDGKDIRCEDITEDGTNFYLFREVINLRNLHTFVASVERGEPFTESQLSENTQSILPQVSNLLDWPLEKQPLEQQIKAAHEKTGALCSINKRVSLQR